MTVGEDEDASGVWLASADTSGVAVLLAVGEGLFVEAVAVGFRVAVGLALVVGLALAVGLIVVLVGVGLGFGGATSPFGGVAPGGTSPSERDW